MKAMWAIAAVGLTLMGSVGSAPAQPYGGYDRGYRDRDADYGDRGPGYRERRGGGGGGGGYRDREYGFDEREYLRCNPDVRRAVNRGQMESGAVHYRAYGRRENRRLSC